MTTTTAFLGGLVLGGLVGFLAAEVLAAGRDT